MARRGTRNSERAGVRSASKNWEDNALANAEKGISDTAQPHQDLGDDSVASQSGAKAAFQSPFGSGPTPNEAYPASNSKTSSPKDKTPSPKDKTPSPKDKSVKRNRKVFDKVSAGVNLIRKVSSSLKTLGKTEYDGKHLASATEDDVTQDPSVNGSTNDVRQALYQDDPDTHDSDLSSRTPGTQDVTDTSRNAEEISVGILKEDPKYTTVPGSDIDFGEDGDQMKVTARTSNISNKDHSSSVNTASTDDEEDIDSTKIDASSPDTPNGDSKPYAKDEHEIAIEKEIKSLHEVLFNSTNDSVIKYLAELWSKATGYDPIFARQCWSIAGLSTDGQLATFDRNKAFESARTLIVWFDKLCHCQGKTHIRRGDAKFSIYECARIALQIIPDAYQHNFPDHRRLSKDEEVAILGLVSDQFREFYAANFSIATDDELIEIQLYKSLRLQTLQESEAANQQESETVDQQDTATSTSTSIPKEDLNDNSRPLLFPDLAPLPGTSHLQGRYVAAMVLNGKPVWDKYLADDKTQIELDWSELPENTPALFAHWHNRPYGHGHFDLSTVTDVIRFINERMRNNGGYTTPPRSIPAPNTPGSNTTNTVTHANTSATGGQYAPVLPTQGGNPVGNKNVQFSTPIIQGPANTQPNLPPNTVTSTWSPGMIPPSASYGTVIPAPPPLNNTINANMHVGNFIPRTASYAPVGLNFGNFPSHTNSGTGNSGNGLPNGGNSGGNSGGGNGFPNGGHGGSGIGPGSGGHPPHGGHGGSGGGGGGHGGGGYPPHGSNGHGMPHGSGGGGGGSGGGGGGGFPHHTPTGPPNAPRPPGLPKIKIEAGAFKPLKTDAKFLDWQEHFVATVVSFGMAKCLDPTYLPDPRTHPAEAQQLQTCMAWLWSNLKKLIQTPEGSQIVNDERYDYDIRRILARLNHHSAHSVAAHFTTNQLLHQLTSASVNNYRGSTQNFINWFVDATKRYNELQTAGGGLNSPVAMSLLQGAVQGIGDLDKVRLDSNYRAATQQGRSLEYHEYVFLLKQAATRYDFAHQSRRRTAHYTDTYQPDEASHESVAQELRAFAAARAPGSRMNRVTWDKLSPSAQAAWDQIDDEHKAIILSYREERLSRPVPPAPRRVHFTDVDSSVHPPDDTPPLSGDTTPEAEPSPSDSPPEATTPATSDDTQVSINNAISNAVTKARRSTHPADPRRVLSEGQPRPRRRRVNVAYTVNNADLAHLSGGMDAPNEQDEDEIPDYTFGSEFWNDVPDYETDSDDQDFY